MIARRAMVLALALLAAACGDAGPSREAVSTPAELSFAILPAENQQSMEPLWAPVLKDMEAQVGVPVKPFFVSNYTTMIEAMRFKQVQVGWFSALPALEATRRAEGEIVVRPVNSDGTDTYNSVIVVKKGSGITLEKIAKCDKTLNFGMGDAKSTSGTLAPRAFFFAPLGKSPEDCFKQTRSSAHQANAIAVANGQIDAATNNSTGLVFYKRDNPKVANALEVVWKSPPIPEASILLRKDLDPALKEKIRQFFLTYGQGEGPVAQAQRVKLEGLKFGGFRPADDDYLDPVREMEAGLALVDAKKGGNPGKIAEAQKAYDTIHAKVIESQSREPPVP